MRPLASLALLLVLGCAPPQGGGGKDWMLYAQALKNGSTAPNYVLITVVDNRTGKATLACTEAPFLLGAIHREREIAYDEKGCQRVMSLALARRNRTFKFSSPEAVRNVQPRYTRQQLEEMRELVKACSDDELRKGLTSRNTELRRRLFETRADDSYLAYRDAVAHLLLERGLLPRRGCVDGFLTVDN
jgi:hypothetical protein